MPRFLLLIEAEREEDGTHGETSRRIHEWIRRGREVGVVQGRARLSNPRLRIERGGGVTVVVACGGSAPAAARALVFEAEDDSSALSWASGCPGEGGLSLFGLDDTDAVPSSILGP